MENWKGYIAQSLSFTKNLVQSEHKYCSNSYFARQNVTTIFILNLNFLILNFCETEAKGVKDEWEKAVCSWMLPCESLSTEMVGEMYWRRSNSVELTDVLTD